MYAMDRLSQLFGDIASLWSKSASTYFAGMGNTLLLAVIGTLLGCVIGFVCGILQTIPVAKNDRAVKKGLLGILRAIIRVYIEVFRGTPMMLQAVLIYFGLPYFTNNAMRFRNLWVVSILVVSINTGAYMAESVRGGILSVDRGQAEGAKAIGMNHFQTMTSVILPQALRNIMPQIGNNFIINVKDTSVMFIIGFTEFFSVHKAITGATYKYFPSAAIEMLGYLTVTLTASLLLRAMEKRMDGKGSYELVKGDPLISTAGTYNYPDKGSPYDEQNREHACETEEERR